MGFGVGPGRLLLDREIERYGEPVCLAGRVPEECGGDSTRLDEVDGEGLDGAVSLLAGGYGAVFVDDAPAGGVGGADVEVDALGSKRAAGGIGEFAGDGVEVAVAGDGTDSHLPVVVRDRWA